MRTASVWVSITLTCWLQIYATSLRYVDPIDRSDLNEEEEEEDVVEKRVDLIEPTCEQLRAVWRYTKRQSRAAKTTNGYPLYHDPFTYNVWQSYSERRFTGRPRSRAAGGAPIYGRMIHKAPAGSRLRNGMRHRTRAFEDVARLYGTINRYPPSTQRRISSFRVGGGANPPMSQLPQAGSFQHLRELIRAERARELQAQHIAEEVSGKSSSPVKEIIEEDRNSSIQPPRKQFLNPMPPLQIPNPDYEYGQGRYMSNVPNIGQAWSRSGPQPREYILR